MNSSGIVNSISELFFYGWYKPFYVSGVKLDDMKFILSVGGLAFLLVSCEKKVEFKLDETEPRLVVEATIENENPPIVLLTRSVGYFSRIDPAILANSFVHDAEVYISNGNQTHRLREYSRSVGTNSIFYYSIDSTDLVTAFNGELNTDYSLKIISGSETYTAVTRIPGITRIIDSLYWKQATGSNPPEKVSLMVRATDPPGFGDYTRYFTRQNNQPFYPGINSVSDDQVIDGTTYDIQVERGVDRNQDLDEGYSYFEKGDTVTLKLSNIDKATYDFWRTMEFTYISVGNPFSSPTKVISNISNGALGYFGGYASQYKTIIIPQ